MSPSKPGRSTAAAFTGRSAPLVGPSDNPPRIGARAGYRRPMAGWWKRDAFFGVYMLRELTAVGVAIYAFVLATGVVCLAAGEGAWNGWLAAMRSPWSLLLHGLLLVSMIEHARSWFWVMPKTMPYLYIGGRRVAPESIRRAGWAAALLAPVAIYGLVRGLA